MNPWWWALIGLAAWFGVSLAVGLWLGPVLQCCSLAREACDGYAGDTSRARNAP